jgi:hypothetical protein
MLFMPDSPPPRVRILDSSRLSITVASLSGTLRLPSTSWHIAPVEPVSGRPSAR